jgi:1-acyl-sn-glycerol-3-phosphate acyltransferase
VIEPQLLPLFQKGFAKTSRVLLERLFSDIWIDREGAYSQQKGWPDAKPLFLFSTHSSWWDPIAAAFLSVDFLKRRTIAPMSESEFKRYKSLRYAGLFGVSQGDGEKAQRVIEEELEKHPESCVWITPQGQFSPNEVEQPKFKNGLARWALSSSALCVPVAIHYYFGHLPRPFVFYRLGKAVSMETEKSAEKPSVERFSEILRKALNEETQELLKNIWESQSRQDFSLHFERAN